MILFWLTAALMIAIALALILPPLLRARPASGPDRRRLDAALHYARIEELDADYAGGALDEAAYRQARLELERAGLQALERDQQVPRATAGASPTTAVVLALLVPTVSFGLYLTLGQPEAILGARPAGDGATADMPHSVTEMVARLEARLREQPNDAVGWRMLGRSYAVMNELEKSRAAFATALKLQNDDVGVLLEYAEVLIRLDREDLYAETRAILDAARRSAPDEPRVLWLSGIAAYQAGDFARAVDLLEQFQSRVPLQGEPARIVADLLAQARAGGGPAPPSAAGAAPAPAVKPAPSGPGLDVRVSLQPELADRAGPADTVFIFARAAQGPRMPLAVVRVPVAKLPTTVRLDDSLAMTPALRLSNFSRVVVGARISKSGSAQPSSGDLQGASEPIDLSKVTEIAVAIDDVVP